MGLDEKALVVARDVLFKNGHWQGLKTDNLEYYLNLIKNNCQFRWRRDIEDNPEWQQIIPYILFNNGTKYFIYHYLEKASEQRLKNDWMLGVGGHINPVDMAPSIDVLNAGAMREWNEEVDYKGKLVEKKLIGILNDESRPVEAVHLGLIYLFRGDTPNISVKETDILDGELVELKELGAYMRNSGGWAPIVYKEYLSKFL